MPPDATNTPTPEPASETPSADSLESTPDAVDGSVVTEPSSAPRRRRGPKDPWLKSRWWFPLALIFSFGLHLILGYGAQQMGWFGQIAPPPPRQEGIELAIRAPRPLTAPPPSEGTSPLNDIPAVTPTPAPVPTPTPAASFNNFVRPPMPTREVPVPTFQTPPVAVAPVIPSAPPVVIRPATPISPDAKRTAEVAPDAVTTKTPTRPDATPAPRSTTLPGTAGPLVDRLPEPLPPGELTGTTKTPSITRNSAGPRSVAGPTAAKSTGTQPAETGGADPGGATKVADAPGRPAAPGEGKNVADAGKGEGTASGNAKGEPSPALAKLGIDRGIPFGSRLGLYNGNPNGGGGDGNGPGGGSDASISRRADGSVFVSMKRTAQPSDAPPIRVVYVIDVSESMREGDKIGKAKNALEAALKELRPNDSFSLVSFGSTAQQRFRMLPATRSNLERALTLVRLLEPVGASGTNFSQALAIALKVQDATHVIILSDGVPTMGETNPVALLRDARDWNTQQARLITMALIGPSDEHKGFDFLRDLAQQNQGRFDYVDLK